MAYQNDLTQGKIWRQLVRYAIPLVLSNILQAMYGMVDMIVAGHFIGAGGISAITNATTLTHAITQIIIGLTIGGNILIGQYYGGKDKENCRQASVTLFTLSMLLGAGCALLFWAAARPMLVLLQAPALEEAVAYLRICAIGLFSVSGYNACSSALRAVGNSKAPLICIIVTSCVNILLDVLFVGVFRWGVQGAALATVIAQTMSFLVSLVFILRAKDLFGLSLTKLYMRADKLKMILKLGIPCALQMSIASISWLSVTYLLNGYGLAVSAGNGVSSKIKDLCQMFIMAMSNAASGMIAQNIGAEKYDRARKVLYTAMRITVCMAVVLILFVQLLAPQLASVFTGDEAAIEAAVRNLRIEIFGQVFYAIFLLYHSLALGAGHTWFVLISSFTNCILARLVLAFLLEHLLGLTGIYLACMIAPLTSVPLGLWYERSNRWRQTLIKNSAGNT